jgi:hypothetical protein
LPQAHDKLAAHFKLFIGRFYLANESMKMFDERLHDLAQARVWGSLKNFQDLIGDVLSGYIGHQKLQKGVSKI